MQTNNSGTGDDSTALKELAVCPDKHDFIKFVYESLEDSEKLAFAEEVMRHIGTCSEEPYKQLMNSMLKMSGKEAAAH